MIHFIKDESLHSLTKSNKIFFTPKCPSMNPEHLIDYHSAKHKGPSIYRRIHQIQNNW